MTKVIWKQIARDFRKSWKTLLFTLLIWTFFSFVSYNVVSAAIPQDMIPHITMKIALTKGPGYVWDQLQNQNPVIIKILLLTLSINFGIVMPDVFRKMPIRILRVLYICPVDRKFKYRYLKRYLWTKTLLCLMIFFVFLAAIGISYPFATDTWTALIFVMVALFYFIDVNLKVDPGNRRKSTPRDIEDEKSGQTISSIYWFLLLTLEVLFFGWMYLENISWTPLLAVIWGVIFLANILIAKYCISSVLSSMLSYEKIYLPSEEEEQ